MEGLEPPCLAALDPKSSASTYFATSAGGSTKIHERRILSILEIILFLLARILLNLLNITTSYLNNALDTQFCISKRWRLSEG